MMRNTTQTVVLGCAIMLMAVLLVASFTFAKARKQLSISYLAQTNEVGHSMAFFTISNAGNVSIFCRRSGSLEILGQSEWEQVGCETRLLQLQPGDCDIATVYLPRKINKPWRFTIYYSRTAAISLQRTYYVTSDWIH